MHVVVIEEEEVALEQQHAAECPFCKRTLFLWPNVLIKVKCLARGSLKSWSYSLHNHVLCNSLKYENCVMLYYLVKTLYNRLKHDCNMVKKVSWIVAGFVVINLWLFLLYNRATGLLLQQSKVLKTCHFLERIFSLSVV